MAFSKIFIRKTFGNPYIKRSVRTTHMNSSKSRFSHGFHHSVCRPCTALYETAKLVLA